MIATEFCLIANCRYKYKGLVPEYKTLKWRRLVFTLLRRKERLRYDIASEKGTMWSRFVIDLISDVM